ncbi:MAG: VTT domain-containing protein [Kiritimatiellia bacterium]
MTGKLKGAPALLLCSLVVALWAMAGLVFGFEVFHPAAIVERGWPAAVGYALLIAVLGGCGVPPVLMILPAAAVWPFHVAFAQSLCGGMGAALIGFLLSRYFLRETVDPRIPPKIRQYEHRLETHGFSTVLVMRLLFYLFPPINWMLGISHISLATFLGGTFLGMIPGTLVYMLTGRGLIGFLAGLSPL